MDFKNISLLIIAGGKSSRLGTDKRFVEVGGIGLLENILRKASVENFAKIFLCVEENLPELKILSEKFGAKLLVDEVKNSGPMAGLATGLANIKTDWTLAVSADIPFFDFKMLRPLTEKFSTQAIIPIVGGKFQPLAAFYRRELAEIFSRELSSGQRKIFAVIKKIPHEFAELSCEEIFFNVNTRADLRLARGRAENLSRTTPIISIVAPQSGTGKTTFIEKLVKILAAQKISVGVIKSDAHGFNLDVEGKDSYKFQTAGAKSVAVISPNDYFMIERVENQNFLSVANKMSGVDFIFFLISTKKIFPTISLWRGRGEVIKNEKIAAIFTSKPEKLDDIYQLDINDIESAEKICKFLAGFTQCYKFSKHNFRTELPVLKN